ncbi:9327_t:CDS:2, partial [Entrophospora sp. SA101]
LELNAATLVNGEKSAKFITGGKLLDSDSRCFEAYCCEPLKMRMGQHSSSSLSNFSKASTSTGISTTTNSALIARKQRTNSQPAPNNINHSSSHLGTSLHNSSNHLKSPSSLSSLTDLESSSSTTSTPCGYKTIDEEIFLAVGDENSNSLNYLNDLEQEKRKLRAQKKKEQQDARFELSIPMKPQEALKTYAPYLSLYERTEIMDFPEVYFVGPNAAKAAASPELKGCNYGFDDERGDYKVVMGDHLCFRFEIVDTLGKGIRKDFIVKHLLKLIYLKI